MTQTRWTKQEMTYLQTNYPRYGPKHCAKKLGRTPQSVRMKAAQLHLNSGIPNRHIPLVWIACTTNTNIPRHVINQAQRDGALKITNGRMYKYTVHEQWAKKFEQQQRQLDQLNKDRNDWLTLNDIAKQANLNRRTLENQIHYNRGLGKHLNHTDKYRTNDSGRPYKYHPTQTQKAIQQWRTEPKYDTNRRKNIIKTLKQHPNSTIDEITSHLKANRNHVAATLRQLEREGITKRTRAPVSPNTRPPDWWTLT